MGGDDLDRAESTWDTMDVDRVRGVAWLSLSQVSRSVLDGFAPGEGPVSLVRRLLAERRPASRSMVGGALVCGDMVSERAFFEFDDGNSFAVVHGYDLSEVSLARYTPKPGVVWYAHPVDCNVVELEPDHFDLLVASHGAHHVQDLDRLFTQARRGLRDGGLLYINEWIGPRHLQIPRRNRMVATVLLLVLFPRRATRTTHQGQVKGWRHLQDPPEAFDPSEACNSLELRARFLENFDVEAEHLYGGLAYPMFEGVAPNLAEDQPRTRRRISFVLWVERWLTRWGLVHPLFTMAVGRRKGPVVARDVEGPAVGSSVSAPAAEGDAVRELDQLVERGRQHPSPVLERRLVEARYRAFFDGPRPSGRPEWPPPAVRAIERPPTIPEIDLASLDLDAITRGVIGHGSLIVRGLLDPPTAAGLGDAIGASLAAYDRRRAGEPADDDDRAWYEPMTSAPGRAAVTDGERGWVRSTGGVFLAESPRSLHRVLAAFDDIGLLELIARYFGERPALSLKKGTLRDVPPDTQSGWHQDGAFLGAEVRALNVWVALSPCGVDAPSLDLVASRLDELAPTGTEGATYQWSVGDEVAERVAGPGGIASPRFEPGDAVLFDQMNLHRTGARPGHTRHRLAIEAWFFAPSHYPLDQIPILV